MSSKTIDPQAGLDKLCAALSKTYGDGAMHRADESLPFNRIPFYEPQLNYATQGGIPFGRFTSLYGAPNAGKSRIALELIAQAQQLPGSAEVYLIPRIAYHSRMIDETSLSDIKREKHQTTAENLDRELNWLRQEFPHGADAIWYNAEIQFDPVFAEELGVDNSRLLIRESTTIEEIVETMGDFYEHVPLHVVDSTTNCSSLISQAQDVGKSSYGREALQWKECLKRSMPSWDRNRNVAILIHQMSTNQKTGGQQSTASKYMGFMTRMALRFDHGRFLWMKDGVLLPDKPEGADKASMAGQAEADGREVFVKVEKSTAGRPGRVAGLQWSYKQEEFVWVHELAASALYYGLARKSGSWISITGEDQNIGQGMKSLYHRLIEDAELRAQIIVRLLDFVSQK